MVTPSVAFASTPIAAKTAVATEEYSNPSQLEPSNETSDISTLEYVVVDGVNTVKATANEAATGDKPLRIFKADGTLLAQTYSENTVSFNIPRSLDSYYSTFGTSTSTTVTPFTEENLWSLSLKTDNPTYKQDENVLLKANALYPTEHYGYAIYYLDSQENVVGYSNLYENNSYEIATRYYTSSTYQSVIATDVGYYYWNGKKLSDLTNIKAESNIVNLVKEEVQVGLTINKTEITSGEKATLTYNLSYPISGDYRIYIVDSATGNIVSTRYPEITGTVEVDFNSGDPRTYKVYVGRIVNYAWNISQFTETLAISNSVELKRTPWSVSLMAQKPIFKANEKGTLAWQTNQPVSSQEQYPYYAIYLYDKTANAIILKMRQSDAGSFDTSFMNGDPHEYIVYVAKDVNTYYGMPTVESLEEIQAISNSAFLQRAPWTASLAVNITTFDTESSILFDYYADQYNRSQYNYYYPYIVDMTTGELISQRNVWWNNGPKSSFNGYELFNKGGPRNYKLVVAAGSSSAIYHVSELKEIQAESNIITMSRKPWVMYPTVRSHVDYQPYYSAPLYLNYVSYEVNQPRNYSPFIARLYDLTTQEWVYYEDRNGMKIAVVTGDPTQSHQYQWIYGEPTGDPLNPIGAVETKTAVFTIAQAGGPTNPNETTGGSNPSENCSQGCAGDPINTATGEFWESNQDLTISQNGPLLGLVRSYATSKKNEQQGFGYGWTNNYHMSLKYTDINGNIVPLGNAHNISVIQENGSEVLFTKLSTGSFVAPARVKAEISLKDDGTVVFTRKNKTRFVFSGDGKLVQTTDANHNAVNLTYDANNNLTKVSNDRSQFIEIHWSNSKISSISDHAGRTVSYAYDSNENLISVTNPSGVVRNYTYDSNHRVLTLQNELGGTTTNTYASSTDDHIATQTDPRGNFLTFEFSGDTTTIRYPDGLAIQEHYNNQKQLSTRYEYKGNSNSSISYVYGADNNISQTTDSFGYKTYSGYDLDGNVTYFQNARGNSMTMSYDDKGNLLQTTNVYGDTSTNTYDEKGNPTSTTSFEGRKKTFTVNPDGTIATSVSEKGHAEGANPADFTSTYGYNAQGYLSSITDANGAVSTIETDSLGRAIRTVNAKGNEAGNNPNDYDSLLTYDAMGNVLTVTDELGNVTTATYDAMGNILTSTNALGQTTSMTYDNVGNLLSSTNQNGKTTTYDYDNRNRLTKITDPAGKVSEVFYDDLGHVNRTKDSLGRETHQEWNSIGQLVSSTDAEGKKSEFTYDANGNLLTSKDPLGNVTTYTYDPLERLSESKNALNQTTTMSYTKDNLIANVLRADGLNESSTYDLAGNAVTSTDAAGKVQTWAYDNLNRKSSYTDATANTESYTYDVNGQVLTQTRTDGSVVSYSYDKRNLLTSVDYPGTDMDISYTYDALGRKLTEQKGTEPAIEYAYDSIGHLTSRGPPGAKVSYNYDDLGNMTSMTYSSGRVVNYNYDDESQLTSLNTTGLGTISNSYNNRGLKTETTLPSGVKTSWNYDDNGRNTGFTVKNPADAELYKKNYAYNAISNITQKESTGTLPSLDDFTYDPLSRLTEQKKNADGTVTNAYEYSATGNLTKNNAVVQSFDDAGNILTSGTKAFDYDARGNRTATTDSADTTENATFEWNSANLLTSKQFTKNNTAVNIGYSYSADGLLSSRSKDGQNTHNFVWDASGSIPLLLDDGVNEYIYGNDRTPVAQISKTDGTVTYLHSDNIGSVTASTSSTGELVANTEYSPYGVNLGLRLSPFGFAGEWTDPDTNHSYLRARWLDTTTGTFLSRDPLVQTTGDAYGYAAGNPLSRVDPLGLDALAFMDSPGFLAFNDFIGGFGDSLTMGGTKAIRQLAGVNNVNTCSAFYTAGEWTGTAASFVIPGGGAARAAGNSAKAFNLEKFKQALAAIRKNEDGSSIGFTVSATANLPVMVYSKAEFPVIANGIEEAIKKGHPEILTRLHPKLDKKRINNQRAAATRPLKEEARKNPSSKPSGHTVDEYPFASTVEGGKGAHTVWAPVSEQNAQARLIRNFNRDNNIKPGDQYKVIIVP